MWGVCLDGRRGASGAGAGGVRPDVLGVWAGRPAEGLSDSEGPP